MAVHRAPSVRLHFSAGGTQADQPQDVGVTDVRRLGQNAACLTVDGGGIALDPVDRTDDGVGTLVDLSDACLDVGHVGVDAIEAAVDPADR